MGEAAGRAAAQAVSRGIPPRDVDVDRLRQKLRQTGAYLRT
jgi:hypothetical protein